MENITLPEWLDKAINEPGFITIKKTFLSYLDELANFHFSFLNPLFWAFFFILLFTLRRRWAFKRAFSYCAIISALLLATTALEKYALNTMHGDEVSSFIIRIICAFIIALISLYYFFIRID